MTERACPSEYYLFLAKDVIFTWHWSDVIELSLRILDPCNIRYCYAFIGITAVLYRAIILPMIVNLSPELLDSL
jgi:hypothetical protein